MTGGMVIFDVWFEKEVLEESELNHFVKQLCFLAFKGLAIQNYDQPHKSPWWNMATHF